MALSPYLIPLSKNAGKSGYLSFIEESTDLPIDIKRVYWIYGNSQDAVRGNHAHINSDRILVCLQGTVHVKMESVEGKIISFDLNDPSIALYFPRNYWINLEFEEGSILIALSSCLFQDEKVERDYQNFKKLVHLL
jgi:hypothetical protein